MNLDHIVNWQLKAGSHPFPGPEGGTCINEAAIVAMGFEYRSIRSAGDCPPCLSRVISAFAINLNDSMPDDLRNELLMPFVTRLSGTADTEAGECARAEFIIIQIARRMIAPTLAKLGEHKSAEAFGSAQTLDDVRKASLALDLARARALALALALDLALALALAQRPLWTSAVEILDEAILMGAHSNDADIALVCERLDAAKELARVE